MSRPPLPPSFRPQVGEDMDKARKADDLEWVAPDLAAFKAPYKLT